MKAACASERHGKRDESKPFMASSSPANVLPRKAAAKDAPHADREQTTREKRPARGPDPSSLSVPKKTKLTNATLAKESTRFGRGSGRRWILNLRGGGGARLAHRVGAMHDGSSGKAA